MEGDASSALVSGLGPVTCASWIRRPENRILAVMGRSGTRSSPAAVEIFLFDPITSSQSPDPLAKVEIGEDGSGGDPLGFAVHPSGDEIVCSTANGCKLYELNCHDAYVRLLAKDIQHLQSVGRQKCLAFSTDGSRFATGGEDGCLRILEWPSQRVILDEPKAHKCFRDMDIRGSNDGDISVVEVKKMEICHWSKKLHLGTNISSLEFCPTERMADIYMVLLGLLLASAILFYIFYENSDSFWNFPLGRNQPARPLMRNFESHIPDGQSPW